jgi:tRNA nucleotidyltransferase (CCA-adding enzyme)
MQRYLVGGAVRDQLLGLPVKDRDFVVIGATPQQMLDQGYSPVGRDFPVFLHPQTREEYALARTERKSAPGYSGFVFHTDSGVTLEQDLARRDLTINAVAQADDGTLIDPFGGRDDLKKRLLRHVSTAFVEDPVRILRLARFSARFSDFTIAAVTAELMCAMVESGEVDALVPERVWQELSRGLMEAKPSRMFAVLLNCGALQRLAPDLAILLLRSGAASEGNAVAPGDVLLAGLDAAAQAELRLPLRLAVLLQALATPTQNAAQASDIGPIEQCCTRLKVPGDCRDLAIMAGRERDELLAGFPSLAMKAQPRKLVPNLHIEFSAARALALLERCDAFRKPERFFDLLKVLAFIKPASPAVANSSLGIENAVQQWQRILVAARAINAGEIAQEVQKIQPFYPLMIQQAIRQARVACIVEELNLIGKNT